MTVNVNFLIGMLFIILRIRVRMRLGVSGAGRGRRGRLHARGIWSEGFRVALFNNGCSAWSRQGIDPYYGMLGFLRTFPLLKSLPLLVFADNNGSLHGRRV